MAGIGPPSPTGTNSTRGSGLRFSTKLSEYTGLSETYLDRYDLRIHINRFCKELLRDRRRTVGRLDSRYTGIDRFADGDNLENDPSGDQMMGLFTSDPQSLLRTELGYDNDSFYKSLSMKVHEAWDYEDFKGHYVNTADHLREVMVRSPKTLVFVANGYYDLATPHFATEYTFNHMGLDESVRKNVRMEYYDAGHMMYVHKPSLERLASRSPRVRQRHPLGRVSQSSEWASTRPSTSGMSNSG